MGWFNNINWVNVSVTFVVLGLVFLLLATIYLALASKKTKPPQHRAPWEQLEGRTRRDGQIKEVGQDADFLRQVESDPYDGLYAPTLRVAETRAEVAARQEREQQMFGDGVKRSVPKDDES